MGRAIGADVLGLRSLRREPIAYDPFLAGRSIVRISGVAETAAGRTPWSLIEKLTAGPAVASAYLYDNARREFQAFESGLLDDLAPSVAAPRAHGLQQLSDGALVLWLEDVDDPASGSRRLTADDIVPAALDLGRLAGRWLGRVPVHDWLFTGWLDRHAQPEAVGPALSRLRAVIGDVELESRLGWTIGAAIELIERQDLCKSTLDQMPLTLCHHDAVGSNVFRRRRAAGHETVLIDWESVGPGPIGADLASLLFSSARRCDIPATIVAKALPGALDGYAGGMREMGARVDTDRLALAVHAAIALRWTLTRDLVLSMVDGTPVRRGSAPGELPTRATTELVALSHVLFDSASEANALQRHTGGS